MRIYLKMPTAKDAEKIFKYTQNKELLKYMMWSAPKSIKEVKKHIQDRIRKGKKGISFEMCIYSKENNEFIGSAGFVEVDIENESVELGYWVARPFWNNGIATEAVSLLLSYAFKSLKAHRVVIMCNPKNTRSRNIAEKLRFHMDGILRDHIKIRGKMTDKCFYSILNEESKCLSK